MAQLLISDGTGYFTVEIETSGPVMQAALADGRAESVVCTAVMLALATLAEGGEWPAAALQTLQSFMSDMRDALRSAQLM